MTTATKRVHITDLHSDHQLWLNSLGFYKEEINILELRLEDVAKRNTASDVLAHLEHFQNQYIRQREVIDELRHDIKQHENAIEGAVKQNPTAVDHRLFPDHAELRDRVITFEKIYAELKADLMRWLSMQL